MLGVTERLEGAARGAEHFRGVCTVVTKLLCMALPDAAYFGQKDAQQVVVIRRLVRDLNLPVRIEVCPTVREPDGLAMSSRNALLDCAMSARRRCPCTARSTPIADCAAAGERSAGAPAGGRAQQRSPRVGSSPSTWRSSTPTRWSPSPQLDGPALLAVAAHVGATRLIDNLILEPLAVPTRSPHRKGDDHMQRVMLKSKIHRATVTDCDLHYVGSITIDPDLLEAADILEHEQVHVVDVDNGARFETYTIPGERGSGEIKVNGAAARLVHHGDTIIVISYGQYDEAELSRYEPRVVHVEAQTNRIITIDDEVATLLA